ncbi:MAG: ADP-ribosylglycohydrolase family protein [Gemmatimonas sp.]
MLLTGPDLADRIRGMLLCVAIGDALGNRSESRSPQRRFEEFGHITDYLPNRHVRGRRVGTPSDDTQLTFWTVEHLLEHGRLEPDALSTVFASRQIYGRGRATGDFVHARQAGASWQDAGQPSAGNGALMRIAPIVLPHLRGDRSSLSRETAIAAAITHNDPLAIASAVAWVALLWRLLGGDVPDSPVAWLDEYINVLRPLDHDQEYVTRLPDGPLCGWRGSASALLDGPVRSALTQGLDVRTACNSWYSGAYLLETVPSVMYILARHGHEPEVAIEKAVNETRDNDTVAAIVGAAMGAAHGTTWIPKRWIDGLLGRTQADDDGRVFELIDAAVARFVSSQET